MLVFLYLCMIVYNYTGYVNRELKEIIVGGIFQGGFFKAIFSRRTHQAGICSAGSVGRGTLS